MNILIVTQYFFPEEFRFNDVAKKLVELGNHVEVVTGLPNYPKGEVFDGYQHKYEEDYNGILIHRAKTRPRHKGSVNLFLNYISFMLQAKKRIKRLKGNFDIVICYMPSPVFQLSPSIYAKKKYKCPLLLMCCDQWPESLKAGGFREGIVYKAIASYCRKVLNRCDHILNVAPSFIEYNHTTNAVPLDKMSWCMQPSLDVFSDNGIRKRDGKKTVDLIFAGNIGKVQNVQDIVLAYNELKYKDLVIHIFGEGSEFSCCKKLVENLQLQENVIFYGRLAPEQLNNYYESMDACLLTLSGNCAIGNTIPSKLANYMSTGKTILAAIKGDSRLILDEAKCGIYTDPDDYLKLSRLIKEYYSNIRQFDEYGENGRNYFLNHCTIDAFMNNMIPIINNLTQENRK